MFVAPSCHCPAFFFQFKNFSIPGLQASTLGTGSRASCEGPKSFHHPIFTHCMRHLLRSADCLNRDGSAAGVVVVPAETSEIGRSDNTKPFESISLLRGPIQQPGRTIVKGWFLFFFRCLRHTEVKVTLKKQWQQLTRQVTTWDGEGHWCGRWCGVLCPASEHLRFLQKIPGEQSSLIPNLLRIAPRRD